MKLQSKRKIELNGRELGGNRFLTCISLRSGSRNELLNDAGDAMTFKPDFLEWRLDFYNAMTDDSFAFEIMTDSLRLLREAIGDTPLVLCFRSQPQGGPDTMNYSDTLRLHAMEACLATGLIDLVDLEMDSEPGYLAKAMDVVKSAGVRLILSHHEFNVLNDAEGMISKLKQAEDMGADAANIGFMVKNNKDLIRLTDAVKRAKQDAVVSIPFCFRGLGDAGLITRICGDAYGSDFGIYPLKGGHKRGVEEDVSLYLQLRELFQ